MRNALIHLDCFKESQKGDSGIFKNVKLLGLQSKNGYAYSSVAVKEAAKLYEGVKVYKDHNTHHVIDDILGTVKNVIFVDNDGLRGDFHANPEHPQFKSLEWNINNIPTALGFSHDAYCARDMSTKTVTKIGSVESLDLVCKPATVNGMFESVKEGVVDDTIQENRISAVLDAVSSLVNDVRWSPESVLDEKAKAAKISKIFQDGIAELKKFKPTQESEKEKEEVMDLTKLTEAELRTGAAELVRTIESQAVAKIEASTQKVTETLAKVPLELQTELFKAQVRESVNDDAKLGLLVADRLELAKVTKVVAAPVENKQVTESEQKKEVKPITVADTLSILK